MSETKSNIFGNQAVALVALLLAVAVWRAPEIIQALRESPTVGPVAPNGPDGPANFVDWVRKLRPGDAETADLIANYEAKQAVLSADIDIASTPELLAIYSLASKLAYPGENRGESYKPLVRVIRDEAVGRGLLAPDADNDGIQDEPLPVDRAGWSKLFADVVEGLQ